MSLYRPSTLNADVIAEAPIRQRVGDHAIAPPWWAVVLLFLPTFLLPFERAFMWGLGFLLIAGFFSFSQLKTWWRTLPAFQTYSLMFLAIWIPMILSGLDTLTPDPTWKAIGYFLGFYLAGCGIFYLTQRYPGLPLRVMQLAGAISLLWLVDGLIQNIFKYDLFGIPLNRPIAEPGHSSSYFMRPNVYGFYMGLFGLIPLYVAWLHKVKWPGLLALLLVCSAGVLAGGARGGWVSFAFGILPFIWLALIKPTRRPWLSFFGLLMAGAIFIGLALQLPAVRERLERSEGILSNNYQAINTASSGRADIYVTAYRIFETFPINGTGADSYRRISMQYMPADAAWRKLNNDESATHPHQVLLEIGAGAGTIGLLGYFIAIFLLIRLLMRTPIEQRHWALPLLIVPIALWWPLNTHRSFYGSELGAMTQYLLALGLATLAIPPVRHYFRDQHALEEYIERQAETDVIER